MTTFRHLRKGIQQSDAARRDCHNEPTKRSEFLRKLTASGFNIEGSILSASADQHWRSPRFMSIDQDAL
jgi:hypothetical protein